jgi:hypothetical protein
MNNHRKFALIISFFLFGILIFNSCASRQCAGIKSHPNYRIDGAKNW